MIVTHSCPTLRSYYLLQAFTVARSLPAVDEAWLAECSRCMCALADLHDCELIGGYTTKGPLNICITVFGQTPTAQALRRDTAKIGDDIWVSGTLGDARLALDALYKKLYWITNNWQVQHSACICRNHASRSARSEEHTSELQSLMRISYAVFCLKKKRIHSLTNTYMRS